MKIKNLTRIFPFMMVFLCTSVMAQVRVITGTITDNNGAPVPGAAIQVKETGNGTTADSSGNFKLPVPAKGKTLIVSSLEMAQTEIAISGNNMHITLTSAGTAQLSDVVVIGYGTARKKDLTGAVSTITAKDFQKGNITTPEQMISGKVAGVAITPNGGRPGEGGTIRIRGGSSLLASNDPLIVVDGIPLDNGKIDGAANPLSFINPNDIESYTVLKDASAAAIYGSRANNGVILITTRKGRAGKLRVTFSSTNSVSQLAKKLDILNADQVRAIVEELGTAKQKSQVGTANTDWQNVIYQTAFGSDNNITLTGGIKGLPFRLSLGYLTQTGILRTDKLDRQSVGLAINPSFFDNHLKVDLNLKGSMQQTRFANKDAIGAAVTYDPTQPVYAADGTYGGYREWTEADGSLVLNRANNPLGLLEQTFDKQKPLRSIGNIKLDYALHFLPELHLIVNGGYDAVYSTGSTYISPAAASNFLNGGLYREGKQTKMNTVLDAYLSYSKDLNKIKSRLEATAGYSYNNFRTKTYNFRELKANRDTITGSTPPQFAYDIPENTLLSYWGRLIYNYDSRYFLTASIRRDGSSRFAKNYRWGWFPSLGLAWSIKNELLQENKTISELKMRFGYGLTGQQDGIGNYDYQARYALGGLSSAYQFGNEYVPGYTLYGYNSTLKWEKLSSYNLAVDFGFLNNRINGSIDFYNRESKDLLNSVPQAAGTNFSAYVLMNVGSLENKGVEFTLNTQPIRKPDFSWDLNLNATYNKNRITNLTVIPNDPGYVGLPNQTADGVNGFIEMHSVGHPRNTYFLFQQVYDANGKPIEGLFADRNRDGIINDNDRYLNHSAVGDWMFGLSSNVNYKNWSGGFVLRSTLNNYVYNNIRASRSTLNQVLGNYTINNASSYYLTTKFKGGIERQPLSDLYVENASFLRMDNLFIGYNFGRIWKEKIGLRATATAQNLFVITKYSGIDPEVNNGVDNNIYPSPRIFALSLNLDF